MDNWKQVFKTNNLLRGSMVADDGVKLAARQVSLSVSLSVCVRVCFGLGMVCKHLEPPHATAHHLGVLGFFACRRTGFGPDQQTLILTLTLVLHFDP